MAAKRRVVRSASPTSAADVAEGIKDWLAEKRDLEVTRRSHRDRIRLFAFWAVEVAGMTSVTTEVIAECYRGLDLPPPADIANQLSKLAVAHELVRVNEGYRPAAHLKEEMRAELELKSPLAEVEHLISAHVGKVQRVEAQDFLNEALRCLAAGAPRAAVILTWIVALDHMYEYILRHKLADFNSALVKRGLKVKAIHSREEFSEIPRERDFIEICRAAGIITNDQRKILDEKLGIRNTCAHPATVTVHERKAANFIEDLVDNIILRMAL